MSLCFRDRVPSYVFERADGFAVAAVAAVPAVPARRRAMYAYITDATPESTQNVLTALAFDRRNPRVAA